MSSTKKARANGRDEGVADEGQFPCVLDRSQVARRYLRHRSAGARARGHRRRDLVQRHQPRHGGAGVPASRSAEPVFGDALPVSGGRVPGSREVRLQRRRPRRPRTRRAARPHRFGFASAPDPLRRAGIGGGAYSAGGAAQPRGAGGEHGNGAERPVGRGTDGRRPSSASSARALSDCSRAGWRHAHPASRCW